MEIELSLNEYLLRTEREGTNHSHRRFTSFHPRVSEGLPQTKELCFLFVADLPSAGHPCPFVLSEAPSLLSLQ